MCTMSSCVWAVLWVHESIGCTSLSTVVRAARAALRRGKQGAFRRRWPCSGSLTISSIVFTSFPDAMDSELINHVTIWCLFALNATGLDTSDVRVLVSILFRYSRICLQKFPIQIQLGKSDIPMALIIIKVAIGCLWDSHKR